MDDKHETTLRTFNTAKVYAEQILFPLMFDFKKFLRQANYGSQELGDASILSEDIRAIQRFNGLKAMSETCADLLKAISSTVRLKGNKEEAKELMELTETMQKIKMIFYDQRHKFFQSSYANMYVLETLDRDFFEMIKSMVETCYVNTEILMTRNKLLFADAKEDFMSDEEIREQIKKEYIDG